MSTSLHSRVRQRWWIIYNALVAPRKAEEIALHTGVSTATVHRVIATYNRLGPATVESPGKGGRRHQYLMLLEEEQFLALHEHHLSAAHSRMGGRDSDSCSLPSNLNLSQFRQLCQFFRSICFWQWGVNNHAQIWSINRLKCAGLKNQPSDKRMVQFL